MMQAVETVLFNSLFSLWFMNYAGRAKKETNLRYQIQDISQQELQMTLEVYLLATLSSGYQPVIYT
jgi:hypothetical protein